MMMMELVIIVCYFCGIDRMCKLLSSIDMMSVLMIVLRIVFWLLVRDVFLIMIVVIVLSLYFWLSVGWVELRCEVMIRLVML